jgi:imidazolonepropionase-like amidohydrolase
MIFTLLLLSMQNPVSVIAADRIHLGDGQVLGPAFITLENGKVKSIEEGTPPQGAIHIANAELTPGLVDAYSFLGVNIGGYTVDESRESGASQRLSETANLDHEAFQNAVRNGVTSAFLSPDSANVFGGLAAFVKTSGGESAHVFQKAGTSARVLENAAALKITLGNDAANGNHSPWGRPFDYKTRRPTTRMGTVWEIRRQFYKALDYKKAKLQGDVETNADLEVMLQVLDGRLPLRVQARRSNDVQTALRLKEEFGFTRMVVEEGTEAWRARDLLAQAGVAVVTGPAYDDVTRSIATGPTLKELRALANPIPVCCEGLEDPTAAGDLTAEDLAAAGEHNDSQGDEHSHGHLDEHTVAISGLAQDLLLATTAPRYDAMLAGSSRNRRGEGDKATPAMPFLLHQAGVYCALGSAESHDSALSEASLIHQARTAVRWGLDPSLALAMVTSQAAALCGQAGKLGVIAKGLDADLVLWSGDPLAGTSRPLLVIVEGQIAADFR